MPRKRMIDPDIWQDEKLAQLDFAGRLFFIGLITQSNDYGKLRGNSNLLKAMIFPYDNHIETENYLKKLQELGIIILYKANKETFIKIKNWDKYQKLEHPAKDNIPEPPENYHETITKVSRDLPAQYKLIEVKLSKDKLKESQASPALQAALDKIFKDNFNIYALINQLKKESKVGVEIPEDVLLRVCDSYWEYKDEINAPWPWFCKVIAMEWGQWNANQNIKEGQEWKKEKMPQSIKEILKKL